MFSGLTIEFTYIYIPNNFARQKEWRLLLRLTAPKFREEKRKEWRESMILILNFGPFNVFKESVSLQCMSQPIRVKAIRLMNNLLGLKPSNL